MTVSLVGRIKDGIKPTPVYKPYRVFKQRRQEQEYLKTREDAYQQLPNAFAPPGCLARSRVLLYRSWHRRREPLKNSKDVRIFAVDRTDLPPWWFQSELPRSFDSIIFSITKHWLGFHQGRDDLIAFSQKNLSEVPLVSFTQTSKLREWRSILQKDLLEAVREAHQERPIDLCFVYASNTEVAPETLEQIRMLDIPVCLWWLDEKHLFNERPLGYPNGQVPLIGSCDVHLTNTFEALRWYMARGAAAYYFPQAVDVVNVQPLNRERDIPVSFVGAAYGYRFEFIRKLRRAGVPVQCFGSRWENGWADNDVEIYSRSIVNLGIGATGVSGRMTCVKGRDFVIPGAAGFYFTTYDPELSRLYHIGQEIACYRNEFDCVEQIRYYLERPDKAVAIGRAGRKRCQSEHTWTKRMLGLLRWMGILAQET